MVVRLRYQQSARRLAPVIQMPAPQRAENRIEIAPPPALLPKPIPRKDPDLLTMQELASMGATLLSPASALAMAMALWRLGQDLGFARNFFLSTGPLSHWQVWFGIAACLLATGYWLNRRAQSADDDTGATS